MDTQNSTLKKHFKSRDRGIRILSGTTCNFHSSSENRHCKDNKNKSKINDIFQKIQDFKVRKHVKNIPIKRDYKYKYIPDHLCFKVDDYKTKRVEEYSNWDIKAALEKPKTHQIRFKRQLLINSLGSYEKFYYTFDNSQSNRKSL